MKSVINKRLINTSEYYRMGEIGLLRPDERVELINGEIFTMDPAGSKHANVVREFSNRLVRENFESMIVSNQSPVHLDQWNEPQPDIAFPINKNYSSTHPTPADILLIAEVTETSYKIDKNIKLPLYASADIPVYWIIHLSENIIEVYEDPLNDKYPIRTLYLPGDKIPVFGKLFDVAGILMI